MTAKGQTPEAPSYYELGQLAIDSFMTLDRLINPAHGPASAKEFTICRLLHEKLLAKVRELPSDLLKNWINEFAEELCSVHGIELSDDSKEQLAQTFKEFKERQEEDSTDESS